MHKLVICLVKAEDRSEAIELVEEFLQGYQNDVWDWYQLGGRWSGILTGYDPSKDPRNLKVCTSCDGTGDRKDLEPPEWKKECGGCNVCGGSGKELKWATDLAVVDDDSMPCTDERVVAKIKELGANWEQEKLDDLARQEESFEGDKHMLGYFMKLKGSIIADEFSFESIVYDVSEGTNTLPKSFEGYWAVVVDMHN